MTKESEFPTKNDQFWRIVGTASGAAIFGGAFADFIGGSAFAYFGAAMGTVVGFDVAVGAALLALLEEQRTREDIRREYPPSERRQS